MSREIADSIIQAQGRMSSDRATWEGHWREIAERILPRADYFQREGHQTEGEKRTDKIFDATACLALERFAAAMESFLCPRTQLWHQLKPSNDAVGKSSEVKKYLEEVNKFLWQRRYSGASNFAANANEAFMGLGAFGTAAIAIDDLANHKGQERLGVAYRALHLSEVFIGENWAGEIDTLHRKYRLTARQAAQRFGADKLPEKIRTALEKTPEQGFDFIHCVKPNAERMPGRRDFRGMPWASYYVAVEAREVIEMGGFRMFPYAVSRYVTGPREIYGRSPAMTVLPDIKMVNEMSKTHIRVLHKQVDPPLLLSDDGGLGVMNTRPGAINRGFVTPDGKPLAVALETGGRTDLADEAMDGRRRVIQEGFLVTLFQILVENDAMTATEAMIRAQEKGALLAPAMGRQQSELLGRIIQRELDIYSAAGALPPMPEALLEAGGAVEIEYVSPLNRAQRAEEGVAILRTLEGIAPLAQINPKVMNVFKAEDMARELAEINGVPLKLLRTPEEMEGVHAAEAEAEQAAQLLEAAPIVAETANNLAQAQATAGAASF